LATERSFDEILFGEPLEKITCSKFLQVLQNVKESPVIEFKTWIREVEERDKGSEEDNRNHILRSVTAFLNSSEGRGLLIIGVKGKERFERVECIPREKKFGNREAVETFIRETIFSYIKALPDYRVPPLLKVKAFSCREDCRLDQDGWLAAIYIERKADSLYYYSIGGKDRAYIREGSRSRELRIDEMLQIIERKRRAIIITILNSRIIDDRTIELEVLIRNIGSKPAMYLHGRVVIIKSAILALVSQGEFKVCIESITHDSLLSKIYEDQNSAVFDFTNDLPRIGHIAVFPYLDIRIGRVRLNLKSSLPGDDAMIFIPIRSLTFTEDTATFQRCAIVVTKNNADAQCSIIIKDYLGVNVLRVDGLELKALPTLKDILLYLT
jgi:hypothetical protein